MVRRDLSWRGRAGRPMSAGTSSDPALVSPALPNGGRGYPSRVPPSGGSSPPLPLTQQQQQQAPAAAKLRRSPSLLIAARLTRLPKKKKNKPEEWRMDEEHEVVPNLGAPLEPMPADANREDIPLPLFYARCMDYIKNERASEYVEKEESLHGSPSRRGSTRVTGTDRLFSHTTQSYDARKSLTLSRRLMARPGRPQSSDLSRDMVFRHGVVNYPFKTTSVLGEFMISEPMAPPTSLSYPHKNGFDINTTKKPGGAAKFLLPTRDATVGGDAGPPRPLRRKQVRGLERNMRDYALARSRNGSAKSRPAESPGAGSR